MSVFTGVSGSCQYLPDSCESLPPGDRTPMKVGSLSWSVSLPGLLVALAPTDETEAERSYTIDLYERERLRGSTSVIWTISDLNAGATLYARFVLGRPEDEDYQYRSSRDLADIFAVRISD